MADTSLDHAGLAHFAWTRLPSMHRGSTGANLSVQLAESLELTPSTVPRASAKWTMPVMTDKSTAQLSAAFWWLLAGSLLPCVALGLTSLAASIWGSGSVWSRGHFGPRWGVGLMGFSVLAMLAVHATAGTVAVLDLVADRALRRHWPAWVVLGLAVLLDVALVAVVYVITG